MELIDTHSHLFLPEFDTDREQVISNALSHKINKIILPNIDSGTIPAMLELCKKYSEICYPAIGLHPSSVNENYASELKNIMKQTEINNFIAIGEVGIDLYWDKTYFREQCEAFSLQIDVARNLHLPVIIHSRDSFDETITILKKKAGNGITGIFHSFTGNPDQAKIIMDLGFKIGINGVVTFKNASLPEAVKQIPLSEIVLETDSPYLTPAPHRGKRNESAYLYYTAQKIAAIKEIPIEIVAETTTLTAKNLFSLK
jgi:TatD DNase family protein